MVYLIETHGPIFTNAYLYADEATGHGFLIDPGFEPERLLAIIKEKGVAVERILLTHGHFDHLSAALPVSEALGGIPIVMRDVGRAYAEDPELNLAAPFLGANLRLEGPQMEYLPAGSRLALAANEGFSLEMVATPGHTEDGTIYLARQGEPPLAFVGDTIFRGSYGRTDFPGGDERELFRSIKERILTLPEDTVLFSGHSGPTTVGEERGRPWYR